MHLGQKGRIAAVPTWIETKIGCIEKRLIRLVRAVMPGRDIVDRNGRQTGVLPASPVIDEEPDELSAAAAARRSPPVAG